jgi:hypothetical protein
MSNQRSSQYYYLSLFLGERQFFLFVHFNGHAISASSFPSPLLSSFRSFCFHVEWLYLNSYAYRLSTTMMYTTALQVEDIHSNTSTFFVRTISYYNLNCPKHSERFDSLYFKKRSTDDSVDDDAEHSRELHPRQEDASRP